jgi:hypothetical protein
MKTSAKDILHQEVCNIQTSLEKIQVINHDDKHLEEFLYNMQKYTLAYLCKLINKESNEDETDEEIKVKEFDIIMNNALSFKNLEFLSELNKDPKKRYDHIIKNGNKFIKDNKHFLFKDSSISYERNGKLMNYPYNGLFIKRIKEIDQICYVCEDGALYSKDSERNLIPTIYKCPKTGKKYIARWIHCCP